MPIAVAPPPAQVASDSRSAVVCVRAAGPRPLFFTGKLAPKRPGAKPPGDFELPLKANVDQCNNLLRSKVADWSLSVTTPGFKACAPIAKSPIGSWK